MGSVGSPETWVSYVNNQDCSQTICSLHCPQWCNYESLLSPPPPIGFSDDDSSGATLSPLVITTIGVFGSVCLLISYYVIISRLCIVDNDSSESFRQRGFQNHETLDLEMDEDDFNIEDDPFNLGPWHVDQGKGLDEVTINSIRVCKYQKGGSLILGSDCAVCLGEFQQDEKVRLLPKCNHAFHVYCIDTWLTSHSNCPLCRANVSHVNAMKHNLPPPPPPPPTSPPPPPRPNLVSDLGRRDSIIDVREEEGEREVRRSVSMSSLCQNRVSIANILFFDQHDDMESQGLQIWDDVGSSKQSLKSKQCWMFSKSCHWR